MVWFFLNYCSLVSLLIFVSNYSILNKALSSPHIHPAARQNTIVTISWDCDEIMFLVNLVIVILCIILYWLYICFPGDQNNHRAFLVKIHIPRHWYLILQLRSIPLLWEKQTLCRWMKQCSIYPHCYLPQRMQCSTQHPLSTASAFGKHIWTSVIWIFWWTL